MKYSDFSTPRRCATGVKLNADGAYRLEWREGSDFVRADFSLFVVTFFMGKVNWFYVCGVRRDSKWRISRID